VASATFELHSINRELIEGCLINFGSDIGSSYLLRNCREQREQRSLFLISAKVVRAHKKYLALCRVIEIDPASVARVLVSREVEDKVPNQNPK
jgi:hypothetical protein